METGAARSTAVHQNSSADCNDSIEQRIAELVRLNAEFAQDKALYKNERERLTASRMSSPIDSRKTFEYFGLMIGSLPPFAVVFKIIQETGPGGHLPGLFLILLATAGVATGIAGYFMGRFVPSAIANLSKFRQPNRIAMLAMLGAAWGTASGAIGGLFLFVFGAIAAGIMGGVVGAATLPILVGFHSALRSGDLIEMKHFLPIAFGITFSLCAFILGF